MTVTPASREAWMVAMAWRRSGRPSIERGISPSPIALTVRSPMGRCCMGDLLVGVARRFIQSTSRRRPPTIPATPTGPHEAELFALFASAHHVELDAVHQGVVRDRSGMSGAPAQCLAVGLTGTPHVGGRNGGEGHEVHAVDLYLDTSHPVAPAHLGLAPLPEPERHGDVARC